MMGSLQPDSEEKNDLNDSGCIQDEAPAPKTRCSDNGSSDRVQLLDLSDDVLLLILNHLDPRDLKAMGYTCARLGALVLDRSLWIYVDARGQACGRARLRWFLAHALHEGTRVLLLAGYAREARDCLGHVNQTREEIEKASERAKRERQHDNNNTEDPLETVACAVSQQPALLDPSAMVQAHQAHILDRYIHAHSLASQADVPWPSLSDPLVTDSTCPGPQFTLTPPLLRHLTHTCHALVHLALEYCNINCNTTGISQFPTNLKKLSLRGSKCYNLPLDRSFLFKIQDYLPELESLDVCECEWMEPASLLPLSKLPRLAELLMRDCHRLTEFVAYASLATRYGFATLETLDLRGSPVGDSEVSALGWLPALRRLLLAAAAPSPSPSPSSSSSSSAAGASQPRRPQHSHYKRDPLPPPPPLEPWELEEPEYFKIKMPLDFYSPTKDVILEDDSPPKAKRSALDKDSACGASGKRSDAPKSSKRKQDSEPGPSKKRKQSKDSSSDSSDDDVPLKRLLSKGVNEGASTSRDNLQAEPRHEVLYVNVGQQLHAVYRLSLDNEQVSFRANHSPRPNLRNIFMAQSTPHIDAASLVTDSAVRRFGRADGEDINIVHIGPNGPYVGGSHGARPDRSNLRELSITGFRHITDRSLVHLATAAPHLEFVDFTDTGVSEEGVEAFKGLRPDCEVVYSPFVDKK